RTVVCPGLRYLAGCLLPYGGYSLFQRIKDMHSSRMVPYIRRSTPEQTGPGSETCGTSACPMQPWWRINYTIVDHTETWVGLTSKPMFRSRDTFLVRKIFVLATRLRLKLPAMPMSFIYGVCRGHL